MPKLSNKNPYTRLPACVVLKILCETPEERKQKHSCMKEIIIFINNILLAVKIDNSLLSVQDINDYIAKYIQIPKIW